LASEQFRPAEETLARALQNDPMAAHCFPDLSKRPGQVRWLYHMSLRYGLRYGAVDTIAEVDGVAVWFRPAIRALTWPRMLRTGMFAAPWAVGWGATRRMLVFLRSSVAVHARAISAPHWYLFALGVRPECQGQGLGALLVRHGLQRAQADGLPCYLETTNEKNAAFYHKYGFQFVQQSQVPSGGPRVLGLLAER
jgi:ribosomal protein S18 acetylase RimI-like enzyme